MTGIMLVDLGNLQLSFQMNKCLLYILTLVFILSFRDPKVGVTKWVVLNGCSLKVDGSTNINKFSCAITNYSQPDTIIVTRLNNAVQLNGDIQLGVQYFDCHNGIMTADLRKTLKAKEHPNLFIRFISLNKYPEPTNSQDITKGMVSIQLAGVTRQFEINYKVASTNKGQINLVGSQQVNFSDFNISPPRKLGGMIRTNNELNVVFNLNLQVIN
jgi:hypothetical protein